MTRTAEKNYTRIPGEKQIIRHPDLSKMTDEELHNEQMYLARHAHSLSVKIDSIVFDLKKNLLPYDSVPLWKLHEDYALCTDRILAIVEEIKYRRIP